MRYYKAFNKDLTCRGFQYEVGKTYTLNNNEHLELCKCGFHFCDILNSCYHYYDNNSSIICLVEPLGNIICDNRENKLVTNKIKIVKRLSKEEIEKQRYIIQDGIRFIGNNAFNCCTSLESITIPNSVTSIGDNAFWICMSLKSITIPNSVTSIGDDAFSNCTSLKSITIPNSVTSIGDDAFSNCTSLKSITIPNSVTSIGKCAFIRCASLESISIPNSVTSIGNWAFDDCNQFTIYGNKNSYAEYYAKKNNIKFEEIIRKDI